MTGGARKKAPKIVNERTTAKNFIQSPSKIRAMTPIQVGKSGHGEVQLSTLGLQYRHHPIPGAVLVGTLAEAALLFGAPTAQEKYFARAAFRSGLLLDIGKINAVALHKKSYGYSDDQERRQVYCQRLKCPHGRSPAPSRISP